MKKADIYMLGLTIYCMTFNKLPYSINGTDMDVMDRICNSHITYEDRRISADLKHMLQMMLDKNPKSRASLE